MLSNVISEKFSTQARKTSLNSIRFFFLFFCCSTAERQRVLRNALRLPFDCVTIALAPKTDLTRLRIVRVERKKKNVRRSVMNGTHSFGLWRWLGLDVVCDAKRAKMCFTQKWKTQRSKYSVSKRKIKRHHESAWLLLNGMGKSDCRDGNRNGSLCDEDGNKIFGPMEMIIIISVLSSLCSSSSSSSRTWVNVFVALSQSKRLNAIESAYTGSWAI